MNTHIINGTLHVHKNHKLKTLQFIFKAFQLNSKALEISFLRSSDTNKNISGTI